MPIIIRLPCKLMLLALALAAAYGVFDAIQNTIVNLQKTGKVGGYELAEDIYQLYKEVADGAPESVHKELLAKVAQGNDFVKSETTGVCNDGLPI